MENQRKPIVFSGIQPSGKLTIGNYLGAINNWLPMEETHDCIYSVVDAHAITVRQEPKALREATLRVLATYIAAGLDPKKNIMFVQSHVPQHFELAWVLDCYTMFGELSRMTQFKDKSSKNADNINAGLFTYPVLMASDILLYQTDDVPVGIDQKQHVELARDIANRFNGLYSDTFKLPNPVIGKKSAKIMSLQDPEKKMSKSDKNEKSIILLTDTDDQIIKKFKSAVTDSLARVKYCDEQPGIKNLITIYSIATGKSIEDIETEFEGKGYGDFKLAVGTAVADMLRPVREKTDDLLKNKDYLEEVYRDGAERAARIAQRTLDKVHRKIGFIKR